MIELTSMSLMMLITTVFAFSCKEGCSTAAKSVVDE
jgi:hypothetical protein